MNKPLTITFAFDQAETYMRDHAKTIHKLDPDRYSEIPFSFVFSPYDNTATCQCDVCYAKAYNDYSSPFTVKKDLDLCITEYDAEMIISCTKEVSA